MLYPLLGFKENAFPAGLGWHDRIQEGVPRLALWGMARALQVPVTEMAALVEVPACDLIWSRRKESLTWEASAQLYRIALALHRLYAVLPTRQVSAAWLKGHRKELDGLVPIRLLLSQPGADAVFAVIARIVVVKPIPRSEEGRGAEREEAEEDEGTLQEL
jgi:putative toxin-antitoxin system antitoxin component (TIGR02293 family)